MRSPSPDALVRRTITSVVFIIAGLSFAFGFGNGWALGLDLGVTPWIAPLVAPAVDLSVIGLLTCLHFFRAHGVVARLIGPRLLLVFCGFITFALNTAKPILEGQAGRACFNAVAPLLLIGWSEVGPKLLMLLHGIVLSAEDGASTVLSTADDQANHAASVPDEDGPSLELVRTARELDAAHRAATRRPITRDKLRAQLKVSNAVAGQLVRIVRAPVADGDTA